MVILAVTYVPIFVHGESSPSNISSASNSTTRQPWTGLTVQALTVKMAKELGLKNNHGLIITNVTVGSPAEKGGFHASNNLDNFVGKSINHSGDVILGVDNMIMTNEADFYNYVKNKQFGATIKLNILRNGQIRLIPITLGINNNRLKIDDSILYENTSHVNFSQYTTILNLSDRNRKEILLQMDYPSNWDAQKNVTQTSIKFTSMPENKTDPYREYIKLTVFTHRFDTLEEELEVRNLQQLRIFEFANKTTIGGINGLKTVFTYSSEKSGQMKILRVAALKSDYVYVIDYHAQESRFDRYLPIVNKMINSLGVSELQFYDSLDDGFSMEYPSSWGVTASKSISPDFDPADRIIFSQPKANKNDKLEKGIEVLIYRPYTYKSLHELVNSTINYYNNTNKWKFLDFKVIKSGPANISGIYPSNILEYSYVDPVSMRKIFTKEFITTDNGIAYSISYSAEESRYSQNVSAAVEFINSFEINTFDLDNAKPYVNLDNGIGLLYSDSWNKTDLDSDPFAFDYGPSTLLTPLKETNWLRDYASGLGFRIFSYTPEEEISLHNAVDQRIDDYRSKSYRFTNFTLLDRLDSTILGIKHPSEVLNYTYTDPLYGEIHTYEVIAINDGKVYHLIYSAEKAKYSKYLHIIRNILTTVQLFAETRYEKIVSPNEAGLILKYPVTWAITENDSEESLIDYNFASSDEAFSIRSTILSQNSNLTSIGAKISSSLYRLPNLMNVTMNNVNITSTNESEFPLLAHKVTFTYTPFTRSQPIVVLQLYTVYKKHVYSIVIAIPSADKNLYLPVADEILNSLMVISFSSVPKENNFQYIDNPAYDFIIKKPNNWTVTYGPEYMQIQPNDTGSDFLLQIFHQPIPNQRLHDLVNNQIDYANSAGSHFKLMAPPSTTSKRSNVTNVTKTDFEYMTDSLHSNIVYFIHNNDMYELYYESPPDKYYNHLPIITKIIDSFDIKKNAKVRTPTGLDLATPGGIAFNPYTNLVYVANSGSNTISVLDGDNYNVRSTVFVGKNPRAVSLDASLNIVYVANTDSNTISVIEGSNNSIIKNIQVGSQTEVIAVNPKTHRVYVGDGANYTIYVIDGPSDNQAYPIPTGGTKKDLGIGLALDVRKNRIYVANPATNNITIIDGQMNNILSNISMLSKSSAPFDISINPDTNTAYIVNSGTGEIASMDLTNNNIDKFPINTDYGISVVSVNPLTNMIYAPSTGTNTLYIVNGSSRENHTLAIDPSLHPFSMGINQYKNLIYISSPDSNTISIINGSSSKIMYRVTYHVDENPMVYDIFGTNLSVNASASAAIYCNGMKIVHTAYVLYDNGTSVNCVGEQADPLRSSYWSGLDSDPANFTVLKHAVLNVKFVDAIMILRALAPILSLIVLVIVIVLASIPSILLKIKRNQQFLFVDRRRVKELLSRTEIIGINATVIVGVLIFLTLSEGFRQSEQTEISMITAGIIFPFAVSVVMAVTNYEKFANRLMIAGFVNLMISTILVVIMKATH